MTSEIEKLEQAIAVLEAQRAVLGKTVIETALAPLREKLQLLRSSTLSAGEETQQRKILTVMFADIPGLGALTEKVDAEDLRDGTNALWESLDAVILAHGGRIDKHMGNGVMALWGAEIVSEDDPEQAIRAALEMRTTLTTFCQTSPFFSSQSETLQLRLGINTGPAIVGLVGMTGEFTAIGDTVNLAARLNQAAQPDEILISYDTYRLVRGVFDVLVQPPLSVKGKTEPIQTYLVQQVKPRAFRFPVRGVEGVETRLIGREKELQALQIAYQRLFSQRDPNLVTVIGDMGLGKSRLLQEFIAWTDPLPENWFLFQGRSMPSQTGIPYGLLRDIFAFRFQIQDSDTLADVHSKMEDGFAFFMPGDERAQEKAHIVGQLIGFDFSASPYLRGLLQDPRQMRNLGFATLARFFVAASQQLPVIIMADDIHWADKGSLDALAYLAENLPIGTPLLMLCMARPALYERFPEWGQNTPITTLELAPLAETDSQRLVEHILHKAPHIPSALREMVVGGADGNPFYVEELIKMLIDSKVIRPGEDLWEIDLARLHAASIPPTLAGVLQARLDRLDALERASLQRASVVGRIFWDTAVEALTPELQTEEQRLQNSLNVLRSKELIYSSPVSTFTGSQEFSFKHALLRDVTYDTVLKRQRAQYHARVAEWLSRVSGERRREYLPIIADHFEKAGENDKAVDVLLEAGENALGVSAFGEAFRFFQRALSLLPQQESSDQAYIHLKIGEAFFRSGEYADALKSSEKALSLPHEHSSPVLLAAALNQIGQIHTDMGNYIDAEQVLLQALPLARSGGTWADSTLARVLYGLGNVYWRLGDLQKARTNCEESRALAHKIGETNTLLLATNRLGVIAGQMGDARGEENLYLEVLSLATAIGNRERAAVALNNLGALADEHNNPLKAREYYLQAIELAREIGAQQSLALYLINLGHNEVRLNNLDVAKVHLREGLALADKIGAGPWTATAVLFFARLAHARGDTEQAFTLIGAVRQHPAFSSDHQRLLEQMLADWQLQLEPFAAQLARGAAADWKQLIAKLLVSW